MKKMIVLLVVLLGVGAVAAKDVFAGTKLFTNMSINTVTRRASGHVSDIRNSADSLQFLNVQVNYTDTSAILQASGRTSANVTFLCTSTNANIIKAAESIDGDDHVEIFWNANGTCTEFAVRTSSAAAPKAP
jgi:hypothetical protein